MKSVIVRCLCVSTGVHGADLRAAHGAPAGFPGGGSLQHQHSSAAPAAGDSQRRDAAGRHLGDDGPRRGCHGRPDGGVGGQLRPPPDDVTGPDGLAALAVGLQQGNADPATGGRVTRTAQTRTGG